MGWDGIGTERRMGYGMDSGMNGIWEQVETVQKRDTKK